MTLVVSRLSRSAAVVWAKRLNRVTITWNAVEGVVVIIVGIRAGSISLIGWGFDSFVELVAGLVLVWRLRLEGDDSTQNAADRRAQRLIAACFAVLAAYVLAESLRDLVSGDPPDSSIFGIALAALSLVVMPLLARLKLQLATALGSRAVQAEAAQTTLCALLSGAVLLGLGANMLFGWWWADPAAGLFIAVAAAYTAVRMWRADSLAEGCCATPAGDAVIDR
jgi:divalent metal cation (Fe/Co/Zn/Cd) transporter